MGKNRKPKNVVQCQIQNTLGTENHNSSILKECLVSETSAGTSKNECDKHVSASKLESMSCPETKAIVNGDSLTCIESAKISNESPESFESLNQQSSEANPKPSSCLNDAPECGVGKKSLAEENLLDNGILIDACENNFEKIEWSDVEKRFDDDLTGKASHSENADLLKELKENKLIECAELLGKYLSELETNNPETELSFQSNCVQASASESFVTNNSHPDDLKLVPNNVQNYKQSEDSLNVCIESELENKSSGNFSSQTSGVGNIQSIASKNPDGEFQGISSTKKPKSTAQKKKEKKARAQQKKLHEQVEKQKSASNEVSKDDCVANTDCGEEQKPITKNASEADKKGKKKLSKKQLAMIHEALKKAKEEEERLRKEEEARQKRAEEAEKLRLEKLRLEQEKKDMKKLKEKKRKEKAKAEGRLLSKSQKQARARMEATLAALRQQGVDVPQICDKNTSGPNRPRLGSKSFQRRRVDSYQSTNSSDSAIVVSERRKYESFSSQESCGKESLSDFPSSMESTEFKSLTPESDKGVFSFSDESDDNCLFGKSEKNKPLSEHSAVKSSSVINCVSISEKDESLRESVKLRSPVVCVLGHVDTGKTKILDHIRKSHVQDSEAGGITQQIGATMIPNYALKEKCKMVKNFSSLALKIPGLLVIDTPGHESFSNLRSRGSSICDIAILVVDIMHGLEPQTIESINLLKEGKTPFVVALNKVDRLYGWKSSKDEDIETTIKNQSTTTQTEFKKRCQKIILEFANLCLNAALFYENSDPRSFVSMVPTSAVTGDGMGNILSLIAQLTQSIMPKKLVFSEKLEATVLEVKAIPGLGTTIDVILVNGRLREGDTIVLAGQEGPIVTQIRSLLMPQALKELRVKNPYVEHKVIEGSQGVKITGRDLEKSVAGLPLFVAQNPAMVESLKNDLNRLFRDAMNSIRTSERGVYVQASTLGSLEALLHLLSSSGVPYFNVKIGPVVKKDVMKASIMLEHDIVYAAILAFDVKVERDAQELADNLGVQIFQADIIYHLFDMYDKYREDLSFKRRQLAVFPCKLRIDPDAVISVKDPLILGVHVEAGILREETPLCIVRKDVIDIGIVSSIELGNNKVNCAKKGDEVRITVNMKPGDSPKTYGKHFSHEDILVSRISRQSIDVCKELFRHELQPSDWHLMVELKKLLHIV